MPAIIWRPSALLSSIERSLGRLATEVVGNAVRHADLRPDQQELVDGAADSVAASRALSFGAEQLLLQHRALFDLLEARASARADW